MSQSRKSALSSLQYAANGSLPSKKAQDTSQTQEDDQQVLVVLFVCPARTYSNGRKSPNRPDSGKVTAKGKGVHREVESEGSRWQTVGPMNKNLVEGWKAGVMLQWKQKPDNYPNCRQ